MARHRRTDGLEVTNDQPEDIPALLAAAFGLAPLKPGGAYYVASPSSGDVLPVFYAALAAAGMAVRQQLLWVKDVFVMGRHDYHYRHEPILYGWKQGAAHFFGGGRAQDTVWEIPSPRRSETHPTMKPVELVGRALVNSCRTGDLVYEPFAGSGTTIIAAEQTSRYGGPSPFRNAPFVASTAAHALSPNAAPGVAGNATHHIATTFPGPA